MHWVRSRLPESLREAGIIWLITRGAIFLLAPLAYLTLPKIDPTQVYGEVNMAFTDTLTGLPHYFVDIWAKWDAIWYLDIAQHGYARGDCSTAFFPLYPLLVGIFRPVFLGNGVIAGIFISLACCLAAFWLLYLLVEIDFGRKIARRTVFYLAIFPTAFFLQTIYTESLFLALTIGCLYLARRRDYMLAGVLGTFAVLTRSSGLLLLVPLFIMYMQDRHWRLPAIRWDIVFLALVPLGLGIWMFYQWVKFGDPWLFKEAQTCWDRSFISPLAGGPLQGLWKGLVSTWDGFQTAFASPDTSFSIFVNTDPHWDVYNIMDFFFAVPALVVAVIAFWRLPVAYAAYALLMLLLPLETPAVTVPLMSFPRFILAAFPLFIVLAGWGERKRWVNYLITVVFLLLLGLFVGKFVVWTWVA